jgi:hypothetical protein
VLRIHRAACWNIDAIVMHAAGRFKEDEYHRVRWGTGAGGTTPSEPATAEFAARGAV